MRNREQVVLLALALLLAAAFVASEPGFVWVGSAAVVAAAVALGASLLELLPRPRLSGAGIVALVLVVAFTIWIGLSVLWSAAPDRSWEYLNRSLVYLAFLALGLFAGRRRLREVLAALLGGLFAWALLVKVFALDDGRRARLHEPIGYWNTLGLLAALAIPLALRLRNELVRALLVYGAVVVVLLTQSRGALALAVAGAVVSLWRTPHRGEAGWSLLAAAPVGVAVAALALSQSGIADDGQPHSERLRAGLLLGAALVVGAAVAAFLARLDPRPDVLRYAAYAAVPVALAACVFIGVRAVQDFDEPVTPESPTRFAQGSSNNRAQWWQEAWHGFTDNPVAGNGAGAFQVTHRRYRESNVEVREPHSLPLQLLTETGVVGFALLAGAAAAAGVAVRAREPELVLVPALFLVASLFDIHWDFFAAGGLAFAVLGALLREGERAAGGREPLLAAGIAALALASVYSLSAPWLAERRVDGAFAALTQGDFAGALEKTRQARALNPLSIEPLLARGYIEEARGLPNDARFAYAQAIAVQPENREAWFRIGALEYEEKRYQDAYIRFNRMYELDPRGPHVLWVRRAQCKLDRSVKCPPEPGEATG